MPSALSQLTPTELLPGDLLFYHGTGLFSRLIRLLDGSDYSHVALFDGTRVVEAVAQGVVRRDLAASAATAAYVHVYRFQDARGHALGSTHWPTQPLLTSVNALLARGDRYAYEQILLLAFLASTRHATGRLPLLMRRILRETLDEAAATLTSLAAMGKQPMICSELVFRCFTQAAPPYPVPIRGVNLAKRTRAPRTQTALLSDDPALAAAARRFLSLLAAADGRPTISAGAIKAARATRTRGVPHHALALPDFVTPADLAKSPHILLRGQLQPPSGHSR